MKKILKEWRNYLNETKRKHPVRTRRKAYDHAATKYTQVQTEFGADPKVKLKYLISNITYSAADERHLRTTERQTVEFINQSELRSDLIEDLKLIHYLLQPKEETKYIARSRNNMMIFDDTGPLADDAAIRIEYLLTDLGETPLSRIPSEQELKRIFYFYIAPNNEALWPDNKEKPEPEQPKTNRFSHALNIDPEMQKRMDKLEAEREARIRASKIKRRR